MDNNRIYSVSSKKRKSDILPDETESPPKVRQTIEDTISIQTNCLYNMNCLDAFPHISTSSVDAIVTDPPFAIEFQKKGSQYNRKRENVIEDYHEVPLKEYYDFNLQWLKEAYRVLKDTGSIFVFSGSTNSHIVKQAILDANFTILNDIVWHFQFGVCTSRKFVCSHYVIFFACKIDKKRKFFKECRFKKGEADEKGRKTMYKDMQDVWYIKREYWANEKKTPNKLPKEIVRKILSYVTEEGDLVLDPFIGSGQVALVAKEMGRNYCGFEISEEIFEFAQSRVQTEDKDIN
jgi:site-specific DNA-methyltransferase (adenine-specific)